MKIAIVGAGRLACTLAPALKQSGHTITEIVSRAKASSLLNAKVLARTVGATQVTARRARLDADLVWFCVPDGKIRIAAESLASKSWKSKRAFHSSGALASDELEILRTLGASVVSVHPLMTFVSDSQPQLKGVPFALEGDRKALATAKQIIRKLGGEPFQIRKHDKTLYHAWGTFASPLLIALLAMTEQVAKSSGISIPEARKKMLPILQQTLANYAALGPAKAFSGPIVRGDAAILSRHLKALKEVPQAAEVYQALARAALLYLPGKNKEESRSALKSKK
jgi:predicted short-subunit dehydrogenase-like oxidoreductase (DUF2520 family)